MSWQQVTLGELCEGPGAGIQTGPFGSQLHAEEYSITGIPVVMPQDLGENFVSDERIARIPLEVADRLDRHRLREGDIVYSRRGDVEKRALVTASEDGWICGTGCLRVRLVDRTPSHYQFVSYVLGDPGVRSWIRGHAVGATMPNLNTSILSAVPLRVPDREVQKGIAQILGALDAKIATNGLVAASARNMVRALSATGSKHEVELSDIADLARGSVVPESMGGVAHFSLPAFDREGLPELVHGEAIRSHKQPLARPAVLLSKLNPRIPRIWDVPILPGQPALASTEFLVLEGKDIPTGILWGLLSQPEVQRELEGLARGTTGSHQRVKPEDALKLTVPDPAALGDQAINLIDVLSKRIWQAKLESRTLAQLRDTLLPALMSGRLSVRDAEAAVSEVI